jgi:hypothetical protein
MWYTGAMSITTKKQPPRRPVFRYTPEDLAPRDTVADEVALDGYAKRNKDALNASIENAHAEFEGGEYFTRDQVMADVKAGRQRRARKS